VLGIVCLAKVVVYSHYLATDLHATAYIYIYIYIYLERETDVVLGTEDLLKYNVLGKAIPTVN
jgi:hypothetical protein